MLLNELIQRYKIWNLKAEFSIRNNYTYMNAKSVKEIRVFEWSIKYKNSSILIKFHDQISERGIFYFIGTRLNIDSSNINLELRNKWCFIYENENI
jgi:hypothetical protein